MWGLILKFIFDILKAIHGVVGDWGLAIIVLTIIFRLILWPLTIKQTRSMANMQKVQPLMKEIQEKYADDKEKQNEEMMKLYSEHKVNPLSGCLPMLIQMPLLIAFYQVLMAPVGKRAGGLLYQYLLKNGGPKTGTFFGIVNIMDTPKSIFAADGFVAALPYFIILVLFGISILLPTLIQPQQEGSAAGQQKSMSYMMAAVMLFVGYSIPAGALLYYDASSLIAVGQQYLTQRSVKAEIEKAEAGEIVIEPKKKKEEK
jgi:YidC/Oxa1 family membrane protein insertase